MWGEWGAVATKAQIFNCKMSMFWGSDVQHDNYN